MAKFKWALVLSVVFLIPCGAFAVPKLINYQGKLTDMGGAALNATVSMTFRLYDDPVLSGPNMLWSETHPSVAVADGAFSVSLGSIDPGLNPLPVEAFDSSALYLGVEVEGDGEMAPRAQLVSVPYALVAGKCSGGQCNPGDFINCYSGDPATMGIGECTSGVRTCDQDGSFGACAGEVAPVTEACNGLDDNCDGSTDNGLTGALCALQIGVCAGSTAACGGVSGWLACDASNYGADYEATEASCDGKDNNCDGSTDNGLTPPPCDIQLGVCAGSTATCGGVSGWLACDASNYGADYEANEGPLTCDGKDNDCDGAVDEECVPKHVIFATSAIYYGDFPSGYEGADAHCQAASISGSLTGPPTATWKALISDTLRIMNARDRVMIEGPVYNTNGDLLANDNADLWDGSLNAPVGFDENGEPVPGWAWTGTLPDGTMSGIDCNGWVVPEMGDIGNIQSATTAWMTGGSEYCDSYMLHLYCISSLIYPGQ